MPSHLNKRKTHLLLLKCQKNTASMQKPPFSLGSAQRDQKCFAPQQITNPWFFTLPVSLKNRTVPISSQFSFLCYRFSVQQTTYSVAVFDFPKFLLRRTRTCIAKLLLYSGTFQNEGPCKSRPKLLTVMEINPGISYPRYNKHTVLVPRHFVILHLTQELILLTVSATMEKVKVVTSATEP